MSSYIRDYEWEQYQNDDDWDKYYTALEEQDKVKTRKRQTKLREYEGYTDGGEQ